MFIARTWISLIGLLGALVLKPPARPPLQLEPPKIEYLFGDFLRFSGVIAGNSHSEYLLYVQVQSDAEPYSDKLVISTSGSYTYNYPLKSEPIRAFSTLVYWIETTDPDGAKIASPQATIFYEDNRYQWQSRRQGLFTAFWYQGDDQYGKMILDIAAQGLSQAHTLASLPDPERVKIYTYANALELRQALQLSGQTWVGAHADPDLDVMVLSIPEGPEQRLEMERQIPHELMHILLYQKLGSAYTSLPEWFNEGLATMAELYPNPDYSLLLDNAIQKDNFLSIRSLCNSFPTDASGAYLAYAESGAFVRYLHQTYGSSGLTSLLAAYQDGLDCEHGVELTFEQNLDQLDRDWRRLSFGQIDSGHALKQIVPWLLILLTVLTVPTILILAGLRRKPSLDH